MPEYSEHGYEMTRKRRHIYAFLSGDGRRVKIGMVGDAARLGARLVEVARRSSEPGLRMAATVSVDDVNEHEVEDVEAAMRLWLTRTAGFRHAGRVDWLDVPPGFIDWPALLDAGMSAFRSWTRRSVAPGNPSVDWLQLWLDVAQELRGHIDSGRRHLLREDTLRWETIMALERAGVSPARIRVEWRYPGTGQDSADLVIDEPPLALIEFKFPRDPAEKGSADTMTLGELAKDIYRLASLPDIQERWAVLVLGARLSRYLSRRTDLVWQIEPGAQLRFDPKSHALLPPTASGILRAYADAVATGSCMLVERVDDDFVLASYRIA